jgi:hypothetical protein
MRPETNVHALFESVGKPDVTKQIQASVRETVLQIATWLTAVPMGSKIRITLARDESELRSKREAGNSDMLRDLESILAEGLNAPEEDLQHAQQTQA